MSNYFMLDLSWPEDEDDEIDYYPMKLIEEDERSWIVGARFDNQPKVPIQLRVVPDGLGEFPVFFPFPIPIISLPMKEVLDSCGVSNIDYYEVQVLDAELLGETPVYLAFNIIGIVAAVDLASSNYEDPFEDKLISVIFNSVKIDESKARSVLIFRLAESLHTIVVHKTVKIALEQAGFPSLRFVEPENWAT
jgi:hypothetical protein